MTPRLRFSGVFLPLLVILSCVSGAQTNRMLDNRPGFKPRIVFTDAQGEKVVRMESVTDGVTTVTREVKGSIKMHVQIVASTEGIDLSALDKNTVIGVTIGAFTHTARLGGDTEWKPGDRRATFDLFAPEEEDPTPDDSDDEIVPKRDGRVNYGWTEDYFLVRISGKDVGNVLSAEHLEDADSDTEGGDLPENSVRFRDELVATVSFAGHTGSRQVYADGLAMARDRVYNVETTSPTVLRMHKVLVVGTADRRAPVITIDSLGNSEVGQVEISGEIRDGLGSSTVTRVVVTEGNTIKGEFTGDEITNDPDESDERIVRWETDPVLVEAEERIVVHVFGRDESGNTTATRRALMSGVGVPTNVTATAAGPNTINVGFTAVAGAVSYRIEYRVLGDEDYLEEGVTPVGGTTIMASLTGLTPATTYEVRVIAEGLDGESNPSLTRTATTAAAP